MTDQLVDSMTIMPLGGGQEVGRSCIYIAFKGRSLLLDCGSHPGLEGSGCLPFFDSIDNPDDIDLILITHFHIDHCAALPYFIKTTRFSGRIFMTHATKAVMKLLLSDNIKLQVKSKPLYTEQELEECINRIEVVDYYQTIEHKGIKFTATKAGHVLGACMFTIEIDGIRILYTGDYSMEEDRHLPQADYPDGPAPDILIVESTFGTTTLSTRDEREEKFIRTVETIISRRGSCLIPVFALGRAQELLLILDDLWRANSKLQSIPIYYASKLANKALKIYETFVNMMNNGIQLSMDLHGNPFALQHIHRIPSNSDIDNMINVTGQQPCVVMASPGFLQSGVSRYLFERWCDDNRNGVIIAGYTVEGTLAHSLLSSPTEITCLDNRKKPVKCLIEHISFSAHVDYVGNLKFIKAVNPNNIILVHGERSQMSKLKHKLDYEIKSTNWNANNKEKPMVVTPQNGQAVTFRFPQRIVAEVVGQAAMHIINNLKPLQLPAGSTAGATATVAEIPKDSILITENFTSKVVTRSDLENYTSCHPLRIKQKNIIPIPNELKQYISHQMNQQQSGGDQFIRLALSFVLPYLEDIFDDIVVNSDSMAVQQLIQINLSQSSSNYNYIVEWVANPIADTIADATVGAILQSVSISSMLRQSASVEKPSSFQCMPVQPSKRKLGRANDVSVTKKTPMVKSDPTDPEFLKIDPFRSVPKEQLSPMIATKLKTLMTLISDRGLTANFTDVKLNSDGTKLIFQKLNPGSNMTSEAYCFISFGDDSSSEAAAIHNAAVSSEDDVLRKLVLETLQTL